MFLVDTHTHLYVDDFEGDIDVIVDRACSAGVCKLLLPNIDADSLSHMLDLCSRYTGICYPMIGLHPTELPTDWDLALSRMEQVLNESRHPFIAIGEVGLDYYWDDSRREEQLIAFERQIEWALRYRLPLMIHSRNAHKDLVRVMRKYEQQGLTGVFHCFGGTADEAEELLDFKGFCLGIGGVVTFKRSTLPDVLPNVPLTRIVLETDSPYLAPVPFRGKRNESSYLPYIARTVARIYNVPEEKIWEQTTQNACRLFPSVR